MCANNNKIPQARASFQGYARGGDRGVGTRNTFVVLGSSSRTAGQARRLAALLLETQEMTLSGGGVDDVVAVSHTEGGSSRRGQWNAPIL